MKYERYCFIGLVCILGYVGQSQATDPNWANMDNTLHSQYQAVDVTGMGTFSVNDPIKMQGVILHWAENMLDPTPGSNPFMGGQWQRFVQAVDLPETTEDDNDFGGTACWMGQNIGKIMGTHPIGSYTDEQWLAELDRLTHDPVTERWFRPGDLVEIRARAPGLFYGGKTNINEQHIDDPGFDFDIVLLQADYGLPTPTVISLSDIKNASDSFIFDATRVTGAEHYQGTAIQIDNISFVSTAGWGINGDLTIQDTTGRTLPVKLGLGSGFQQFTPPTGTFSIRGIFDQEDADGSNGWTSGYRLWAMEYDGSDFLLVRFAAADFDQDGDVDPMDLAHFESCASGPAVPQTDPNCFDADLDQDSDVDVSDFGIFQRCISGEDKLANPACSG